MVENILFFYLFSWCGSVNDDGDELQPVADQPVVNETQSM